MRIFIGFSALLTAIIFLPAAQAAQGIQDTLKIRVGKALFFDMRLSEPAGQACATCHEPAAGYNGNGNFRMTVFPGAVATRSGIHNPPSVAYAFLSPAPGYYTTDEGETVYMGGQFWDGNAATMTDQAKGPFLNPLEMNNPDGAAVAAKACASAYAAAFRMVYGTAICNSPEKAFAAIADAIAAFESSSEVNPFSSKYDLYLAGKADLTPQERHGLELFEGEKARCFYCHPSGAGSPFTDFSYDNAGIPKNTAIPAYAAEPGLVDLGLGGRLGTPEENGKFKVPTLRNVALAPPYGHNGYFQTLKQVVHFYNTRDVGDGPAAEYPDTVNHDELGDLGLTDEEEDAIVAFLGTLTDGYGQPASDAPSPPLPRASRRHGRHLQVAAPANRRSR
jgi:cytochrome c peroxidase